MRVHSCLKAMKTEASVPVDVHCRRAPVPAMSPREELMRLQANSNPKLPAVCDSRANTFVNGVSDYDVSADGRKLVYRAATGGGGGPAAFGGRPPAPSLFIVDSDRTPPQPGQGRLNFTLRMYLDPKEEFKQIFNEGWRNQRDYLYVPNLHGTDWVKDKEMYGAMLPYVMHRADLNYLIDMMGAEIAIGHSY